MKRYITPSWTINSVYDIQPQDLLKAMRRLLSNLDNTAITWNNGELYRRNGRLD